LADFLFADDPFELDLALHCAVTHK